MKYLISLFALMLVAHLAVAQRAAVATVDTTNLPVQNTAVIPTTLPTASPSGNMPVVTFDVSPAMIQQSSGPTGASPTGAPAQPTSVSGSRTPSVTIDE